MIDIRLSKLMNDVPVGYLADKLWITKGGKVLPVMLNEYADIELENNTTDESITLSYLDYERLTREYFMNLPKTDERQTVTKHLAGQHDQSTHAGKKSYKSIDDLVKDGLDIQEAVDELGTYSAADGNVAMRVLLERVGKGGKPEIVASVADLDGEPIYRGAADVTNDGFKNADYDRYATGQYGDGYYFSNVQETALDYAESAARDKTFGNNNADVITAGWKNDAKVLSLTDGIGGSDSWIRQSTSAQNKAIDKLNINTRASDNEDAIFNMFYSDYGNALVTDLIVQGFDGMSISVGSPRGIPETYTIVFNREALQVVSN